MIHADAVVVGAGPAGATFALNLAPTRQVMLVDRRLHGEARIGESLAPAARRLLTDMGLWDSFREQGHRPNHGGRSVWGSPDPVERDQLRDLDGPAWRLDRVRFDDWLRQVAIQRGAAVFAPALPRDIRRYGEMWRVDLTLNGRSVPIVTRLLVDAGGRGSSMARRLGARRIVQDRLVCGWLHGVDNPERQSGLTYIEAEPDGWWYTAPLPDNRRVVAFHADADLPAASVAAVPETLLRRALALGFLANVLNASGFTTDGTSGFCAAHSAEPSPAAGEGWLAVGDAALSFDPLSSQGLFNALYTGLAAAEAADRFLSGDQGALNDYAASLSPVAAAYRAHLDAWYRLERRWPDRPFWHRRLNPRSVP